MTDWYESRTTGDITHYCGGIEENKDVKSGTTKPKETQTKMTKWFQPTEKETDTIKCKACLIEVKLSNIETIKMGEAEE